MRVVIDTDVLVSGLRSAAGASRVILLGVRERVLIPLLSVAMLLEYEAVLKRSATLAATGLVAADVDVFLDAWAGMAEAVPRGFSHRPAIMDPDDELFLQAAINGGAAALITFNVGDYRPADDRAAGHGVAVVRPGAFLRRLAWRPSTTSLFAFRPN